MTQNSQYTEEILSNIKVITQLPEGILVAIPLYFNLNCELCKLLNNTDNCNCSNLCYAYKFIKTTGQDVRYTTFILRQEMEDRYLRGELIIPEIDESFKLLDVIYNYPDIARPTPPVQIIQESIHTEFIVIREDDYGVLVSTNSAMSFDTCDCCLYVSCLVNDDPCNMCLCQPDSKCRYLTKEEELRYIKNKLQTTNGTS